LLRPPDQFQRSIKTDAATVFIPHRIRILHLQSAHTLVLYACFSFNWSTRQYVGHAFSKRDIIHGAWNLRHKKLMGWVLLHGEYDNRMSLQVHSGRSMEEGFVRRKDSFQNWAFRRRRSFGKESICEVQKPHKTPANIGWNSFGGRGGLCALFATW
jgi:hypothetical protein